MLDQGVVVNALAGSQCEKLRQTGPRAGAEAGSVSPTLQKCSLESRRLERSQHGGYIRAEPVRVVLVHLVLAVKQPHWTGDESREQLTPQPGLEALLPFLEKELVTDVRFAIHLA